MFTHKLTPQPEEFGGITEKDLFVLLIEALPSHAWYLGQMYARLLRPVPLAYPFSEDGKTLLAKMPLLSLMTPMGEKKPFFLSFGAAGIGKSSLLNKLWQLRFPAAAESK